MKSNPRMTIISRNIRADLSRECHFSNSAKRDQYSPQIIRSLQNWFEFQILDLWSPLFSTRSMVRDYAEQQNSSCCATAG